MLSCNGHVINVQNDNNRTAISFLFRINSRNFFALLQVEISYTKGVGLFSAHRGCIEVYKLNALLLESRSLQAATYKAHHLGFHEGKPSLYPFDITSKPKRQK